MNCLGTSKISGLNKVCLEELRVLYLFEKYPAFIKPEYSLLCSLYHVLSQFNLTSLYSCCIVEHPFNVNLFKVFLLLSQCKLIPTQ
jgi:hypothetical protein